MKRSLIILFMLMAGIAAAIEPYDFKNSDEEARFRELLTQLRCVMCQNQSLVDSNAGIAADLRREVFTLIQEGKTDAQIKDYLVERYSEFVLYQPPVRPGTWLLWFGPLLIVLSGAVVISVQVRKNRTQTQPTAQAEDQQEW